MISAQTEQIAQELEDALSEAVPKAYQLGIEKPRSPEKLKVLHHCIAEAIRKIAGADFEVHSFKPKQSGGELSVQGKYYDKSTDITVVVKDNHDKVVLVISVKFALSNYQQNAVNYFETLMGETANLQRQSIPVIHFICLTHPIPYRANAEKDNKLESIKNEDIAKHRKLVADIGEKRDHNPRGICFQFFTLQIKSKPVIVNKGRKNERSKKVPSKEDILNSRITGRQAPAGLGLSEENARFLQEEASLRRFIETATLIIEEARGQL